MPRAGGVCLSDTGRVSEAGEYRLPRSASLRGAENYRLAFAARQGMRGRCLALHVRRRESEDKSPRLGLVIGKRYCRQAVRRNLIKRLVREHFRKATRGLAAMDVVVRLHRAPPDNPRPETKRLLNLELYTLFRRLAESQRRTR